MNSFDNINSNLHVDYNFYIYDVSPYSFDELRNIISFGSDGKLVEKSDLSLYNLLKCSKYRTNNPEKAKLFIIPIDFEKLYFKYKENIQEYYDILNGLINKIPIKVGFISTIVNLFIRFSYHSNKIAHCCFYCCSMK